MLLMVLALSSGGKGGSSDFLDAMLISSNMMPETMRLLFAMMSIQKRNSRTNTLATETAAALKILADSTKQTPPRLLSTAQLDAKPELKALLDRVSASERDAIVSATGSASVDADPNTGSTRALAKGKDKRAG
jgi:hypothetical protein